MALPYGGQGLAARTAIGQNFGRREPLAHGACGIHKKVRTPFA
jgi:hypothetical protein